MATNNTDPGGAQQEQTLGGQFDPSPFTFGDMNLGQNYNQDDDLDGDQLMGEPEKPNSNIKLPSGFLNLQGSPLEGETEPYNAEIKSKLEGKISKVQDGLEDLNYQMQSQVGPRLLCQAYGEIREDLKGLIDLHSHHYKALQALETVMDEATKTFFLDTKDKINKFYTSFRQQRVMIAKIITDKEAVDAIMRAKIPTQAREGGIKSKGLLKMKHISIPSFEDNKKGTLDYDMFINQVEAVTEGLDPQLKAFYLKESLGKTSKALQLVINRNNYDDIKEALDHAYGNTAILLQNRINEMIEYLLQHPGYDSASNLRNIHSDLLNHISYLSQKTVNMEHMGNLLLVSLSLQRIPQRTRMYLTQKKREIEDNRGISLNIMDVLSLLNEYCNTAEISEVKMVGKSRKEEEFKHLKNRREEQKTKK